jgi:hypothetical protein
VPHKGMTMRIRTGLLITATLLSACTSSSPAGPSAAGGHASSPTPDASPATPAEPGWLAIDLGFEPGRSFFTEGSISFVEVRGGTGELVAKARSRLDRVSFRHPLAPGRYDVRTYLRPCDGSCRALDPPRDLCEFVADMTGDGANRLIVVRVGRRGECRVSDRGDVIDLDVDEPVMDLPSFSGALTAAGHEVRVRTGGWPWLRPFFLTSDRIVAIRYHEEFYAFEYSTRAKLQRIRISADGTGISRGNRAAIIEWTQPHFYRSGRLLVLYLGGDPVILETLSLILGPQFAGR